MSQKFPQIESTDYIDTGILDLQDRDNAVLTLFAGESEPENPFQDLIWNDLTNKCLKRYNENEWEVLINYGLTYVTEERLRREFQALNSNLTNYSSVEVDGTGFINNTWVSVSSFFINNLSQEVANNIGLNSLAYKNKIKSTDIANGSIPISKVNANLETNAPYKIGDCTVSFNLGNKEGCVRLSKSSSSVYTVGATSSNATYRGSDYQELFSFVWSNLNLPIYTSNGILTSKGETWQSDWNVNKKVELPHIVLASDGSPSNPTLVSSSVSGSRGSEKLDIETQYNSQKTISGSVNITKEGYYNVIIVAGGGGSSNRGTHLDGHSGYGGAGAYFQGNVLLTPGVLRYEIGYGGKGCYGYARNHCGWDGSYSRLTGTNLYINCPGGYGGRCSRDSHVPSGIRNRANNTGFYQGWSFAPNYSINTEWYNVTGASSTGSRKNSWYGSYGKGADTVGDESAGKEGENGFISIVYIGPKEYGTIDTNVINSLNILYSSFNYFMKY